MRFARAPMLGLVTTALGIALCFPASSSGDDGPRVVRIEESWELQLAEPNANDTAPQITCAFTPFCNLEKLHATFEISHLATP